MNQGDSADLVPNDVPDVSSTGLSSLLGNDDPALTAAVRDLVARLSDAAEVTLGWNNYVGHRSVYPDRNSTS